LIVKPTNPKKRARIDDFKEAFNQAWNSGGSEMLEGAPYVSRKGLREHLQDEGWAERTIGNHLKPSETKKLIGAMLAANLIRQCKGACVVHDLAFGAEICPILCDAQKRPGRN
jgi:hypothetical protein